MTKQFEAGKTYATRSIGDHNCIIRITVVSRTAKTIKVSGNRLVDVQTFRVFTDCNGNEAIRPWGNYSMCPIISADERADLIAA